jgi:phospholipid/cholesterol/gamma-HCH transport system substrate-binding protein
MGATYPTKGRRGVDMMVGGFVLLGLAALLFLAMKVGNLGSFATGPHYETVARFDNIGGLKVRAPVKSAGVVVGRVAAIDFDEQTYQARVVMRLDAQYQFPKDSSAKILTAGLLGEQYVGLEAGADERMLAAGDVISMTQSAVVLENLIGQVLFNKAAEGGKAP